MGEIRGALLDILAEHERFRDKIKSLEQEIEKLKEEVKATHNNIQQNRIQINNLEQYSRKKNIKLLNVKENPNETVSETERKVIEIASSIDVTLNPVDIDIAHRVGKPTDNKNRPIIVRLMHLKTKSALFQNRRKLKGRPIVLVEDLIYENARLLNQVRGFSFVERSWSMGGVVYAKSPQGKIVRVNAHDNEHSLRALLCSSPLQHEYRRSYKHYRDGQNRGSTDFKHQRYLSITRAILKYRAQLRLGEAVDSDEVEAPHISIILSQKKGSKNIYSKITPPAPRIKGGKEDLEQRLTRKKFSRP
ncbi:hypothetical protein ElyMa_007015000 [Elysia marginata]|uniref:Uncharacterized protein n=1 Tax=Elysia marginata TaxID=1093978 RepID=A0AAV4JT96_9GAST|nr:hypothetical protein ElyMa_007015000 [Elysia marginata]